MAFVGYTNVANQANTSDGFALHASAANIVGSTSGDDVGDSGVVDLYGATAVTKFYILMESAGYVLQEDEFKIVLEAS
tara:strand:+ start:781 stop:1014 length:234 start_codon:yes stop_codon:yes gene_type:complete